MVNTTMIAPEKGKTQEGITITGTTRPMTAREHQDCMENYAFFVLYGTDLGDINSCVHVNPQTSIRQNVCTTCLVCGKTIRFSCEEVGEAVEG